MALTPLRWAAALVAGCIIVLTLAFRPDARREFPLSDRQELTARVSRASSSASLASANLRSLQVRDSVLQQLARMARSDTTRVVVGRGFPPNTLRLIGVMRTRLDQARQPARTAPIDVAFVMDSSGTTSFGSRGTLRVSHALPAGPADRCTAIVRIQPFWLEARDRWLSAQMVSLRTAAKVLGPCAFFEAFGIPGRGIDRWLVAGAVDFAAFGSWTARQEPLAMWGVTPQGWTRNTLAYERASLTPSGLRCASGDVAMCGTLMLRPHDDSAANRRILSHRVGRLTTRYSLYRSWGDQSFGISEPELLAGMVRSVGPDRFRQFWTSEDEPGAAFQRATGQDIGAWAAQWMLEEHGAAQRGPGTSGSAVAYAAGIVLLAIGGAGVAARRRQVA